MPVAKNYNEDQVPTAELGRCPETEQHDTTKRLRCGTKRSRAIGKLTAVALGALAGLAAMTTPAIALDNSTSRDPDRIEGAPADLAIRSASVTPATATEWQVRLVIDNRGDEAAPAFDTTVKNGQNAVARRRTSALAGHRSTTHAFRVARSACFIVLRIEVDSGRVVGEQKESNNVHSVTGRPVAAARDCDGDGLVDSTEDTLAARFFPYVWFDSGENAGCTAPATPANNGTALARVRPHPSDRTKIAIQYVILYRRDCGDVDGAGSHAGDVEPFSITVAPNPACPDGYGASWLKTIAHEGHRGTFGTEHIDERNLGNDCRWGRLAGGSSQVARIYASENKHGIYASDGSCDSGGFSNSDNCSESFTLRYNVHNVGEDNARLIDELSSYQFRGEFAWSKVKFSGGLGGEGIGPIRGKWTNDRLLARV